MDAETAELRQLRTHMYSDEGTLIGVLGPLPPNALERYAAALVRSN